MHTCTHVRVQIASTSTHMHKYMCEAYMHNTYIYEYNVIHTYLLTCMHAYIGPTFIMHIWRGFDHVHACLHACLHAFIQTYMHISIYAYKHACTHAYRPPADRAILSMNRTTVVFLR